MPLHHRKKKTGVPEARRVAKKARSKNPVRAECGCTSKSGHPKTLFTEKWDATRVAGNKMGAEGEMWEIYKCPRRTGFHIGTVRWDPWEQAGLTPESGTDTVEA